MTPTRTFRLDPTELAANTTFDASGQKIWDGKDVEYALESAEWRRRQQV